MLQLLSLVNLTIHIYTTSQHAQGAASLALSEVILAPYLHLVSHKSKCEFFISAVNFTGAGQQVSATFR